MLEGDFIVFGSECKLFYTYFVEVAFVGLRFLVNLCMNNIFTFNDKITFQYDSNTTGGFQKTFAMNLRWQPTPFRPSGEVKERNGYPRCQLTLLCD